MVNNWFGEIMDGAAELIRRLRGLGNLGKDIVEEITETATQIEIGAIGDAPIGINQKIAKVAAQGGLTQTINVNAGNIGAYVEFGTGQSAQALVPTLPKEFQDIARTFYINGQGRLIAKPYFYPNWVRYTNGFEGRLLKIVNDAANGRR